MDSENKFWSIANVCAMIVLCVGFVCAKGCNHSNNEMMKHMANMGCSKIAQAGDHHNWVCPATK